MSLQDKIQKEIDRLSSSHQKEDIYLINDVLRPMLQYIEDHHVLLEKLIRISGKHGI